MSPSRMLGTASVLALAVALLLTSSATAAVTTSYQSQPRPGLTERVIWGQNQVAIYKVSGVNHIGPMHFAVHWQPTTADLDLYLLDASQTSLNEPQGFLGESRGRETIDWFVASISPAGQQLVEDPVSHELRPVGDTYYLVVTAYNGAARFWVNGTYPRIATGGGIDTTSPLSLTSVAYRRPLRKGTTQPISGAAFGNPFTYLPTSVGAASVSLQWPANVATKRVTYDLVSAPEPANFQHYGFAGSVLDPVFASLGPANWAPPAHGDPPAWYGLYATYTVAQATPTRPGRLEHYVPVLYLVARDPALGPDGPLKTGVSTVGYRATLDFPQNLYLASAPGSVFRRMPVALRGALARDGGWAAPKTPVKIQRLSKGVWRTVTAVKVGKNGAWTAIVYPRSTASWRAQAAGNALTGLAVEHSTVRRIVVY